MVEVVAEEVEEVVSVEEVVVLVRRVSSSSNKRCSCTSRCTWWICFWSSRTDIFGGLGSTDYPHT